MAFNYELHAKEFLLNPILQDIYEGLIITDTSKRVVFLNETAENIFGIKANQILGNHIKNIHPDLQFQDTHENSENNQIFINNNEILVNKHALEVTSDTYASYIFVQPADRFNDKQLYSLLESPYEAIAVFNDKIQITYANQVCYRYFKCTSRPQLEDQLLPLISFSSLKKILNTGKAMSEEILTVKGREVELIYLPITWNNRTAGIIVKGIFRIREERNWSHVVEQYKHGTAKYYINDIVGNDVKIAKQKELAIKASRTISTILITGESGTGKEVFAHAIHNSSPRRKEPFIKVNCAAIPETLLESELFGYAEGAFTGARKEGKPGKFELANHGTIFLDEIGDMSLSMQAKLLRVLQDKEVERIGGTQPIKVNVRIITASNQDLKKLVAEKKFREDLYYRLNVIILDLPPLRERKTDIPLISNVLLKRLNIELGSDVSRISDEVIKKFMAYDWPGNIRELENTLERAINFCENANEFTIDDLPNNIAFFEEKNLGLNSSDTLEKILEQSEKKAIISTLNSCGGNKSKTARALDIHRSVLYKKISKYNINL